MEEITEDTIDDLTAEIEDLLDPSENRDEIWRNIIVPLTFEAMEHSDRTLTPENKNFIGMLRNCYGEPKIDASRLKDIRKEIETYKCRVEETDFYNVSERCLLSTMILLTSYPKTRDDWNNGILWLNVSGWMQFGVPVHWIYDKLHVIKGLLSK